MQRTVVEGLAGAVLSISALIPGTFDQAGYEQSGMNWTPVGEIENYGNHGVTATITTFTPIDTAVVTKIKGSKDYGNMALMIGNLPSDAGQAVVALAVESINHYSIRIVYPDTSIHYLDVLVSKFEYQDGAVNDVQKISVDFALCRKPVIVAQV